MKLEEDIKIVEERIETLNKHIYNYEKSECRTSVYQELVKEKQAFENLLNACKKNQNIVDRINNKIKELQDTCAEIQGTEHEGETVLYLMEIDLLQKLL